MSRKAYLKHENAWNKWSSNATLIFFCVTFDITTMMAGKNQAAFLLRCHRLLLGYNNVDEEKMSQLTRLWYLSHRRPANAQASLRICAVSPGPSLFAHMNCGSRRRVWQKIRYLAPLDGFPCAFEEWVYGGRKVPWSHELAQMIRNQYYQTHEKEQKHQERWLRG